MGNPISQPDAVFGLKYCSGCGKEGYDGLQLQQFSLRVSPASQQVVAYCQNCSLKVAAFLLTSWIEEDTHDS